MTKWFRRRISKSLIYLQLFSLLQHQQCQVPFQELAGESDRCIDTYNNLILMLMYYLLSVSMIE